MVSLEYNRYPYSSDKECLKRPLFEDGSDIIEIINSYLLQTKGPALEIGGPTKHGYLLLDDVEFPNKLIISNAYPEDEGIVGLDVTTRLPFENDSLGCVISSCLPLVDLVNPLRDPREVNLVIKNLDMLAASVNELNLDNFTSIIPRMAFIKESYRVLEEGGLLIVKSLLNSELKIIKELGFEEIVSINCSVAKNDSIWIQKEYIFRLNRLNRSRLIGMAAVNSAII